MPKVKISKIVSCSSESKSHPATNLLILEPTKTTQWRNDDPKEDTAEVVLQLEMSCKITNINIGNCFSAKIEIQVGCSGDKAGKFETLLPSQEFMNESESRNGTKSMSVRTFLSADFDQKIAREEKWDLVKVICSQPYIKNETFGLAFIAVYTDKVKKLSEESPVHVPVPLQKSPRMIGKFKLREDSPEEDEPKGVGLLERWKKEKKEQKFVSPPFLSSSSASSSSKPSSSKTPVTNRNRMSLLYDSSSSDEENKRVKHSAKKLKVASESLKRKSDDDTPEKKPKKQKNFSAFLSDETKVDQKPSKQPSISKQEVKKKTPDPPKPVKKEQQSPETPVKTKPKLTRPFKELLHGVRIVISGIANPERADIRQKALDMGAKYSADWNNECTHLICAFKNTPKFNQVKGKGKIVTKDWITNGFRLRRRLPWRRYALDDADRLESESEEDICEEIPNGNTAKKDEKEDDVLAMYDLDYNIPDSDATKEPDDDVYNRSTDDDNSREPVKPKLFQGNSFYIHVNVEQDKNMIKSLEKKIFEQRGQIVKDLHAADIILTTEKLKPDDIGAKGDLLDPKWVLECVEMDSLIPKRGFLMNLK